MASPKPETERLWLTLYNRVEKEISRDVALQATQVVVRAWHEQNNVELEAPGS